MVKKLIILVIVFSVLTACKSSKAPCDAYGNKVSNLKLKSV